MVSTEGGVEIEKVAAENPDKIVKEWITPNGNLKTHQARKLALALELTGTQVRNAIKTFLALWKVFKLYDCSLMEINPLVITKSDEVIALDSKINFDDNALFRHKDIQDMRDLAEEEPLEVEADSYNLNYIKLDGDVGCMVNGAGLAMGTMDIIKLHGGEPANFLDVGGGANTQQVTEAFQIILSDSNVKAILVNIFGGIARCTTIAQAIIESSKEVGFTVPLVVRLEGTEVEEGRKMLAESDITIISAESLTDAAKKVVAAAG